MKKFFIIKKNRILSLWLLIIMFLGVMMVSLETKETTAYANGTEMIDIPYPYNQSYFDEFTNSDSLVDLEGGQIYGVIQEYTSYFYTSEVTNVWLNYSELAMTVDQDDPIVRIIPRELFERRGVYLHIGREYGFYVNTVAGNNSANVSCVFVFDIIKYPLNNSAYPSQYVIEIKPLF